MISGKYNFRNDHGSPKGLRKKVLTIDNPGRKQIP